MIEIDKNGNMSHETHEFIRRIHDIEPPSEYQNILQINRFKKAFPGEEYENGFGFIFFTKPELNFFERGTNALQYNPEILKIPHFQDTLKFFPEVFRTLQNNQGGGPLVLPLCNLVKNFSTKDTVIKTRESAETANDWKIIYGHRMNDSKASDTIDFQFSDDRNLMVYKTIEAWVNYISLISEGYITPHPMNRLNKILDYASSIYYFLVAEDCTSILYYTKLIGAFPINIPESSMAYDLGNFKPLEYNVTFQYSFKDTSPLVIKDFNNVMGTYGSYVSNFNKEGNCAGTTWVNNVFIEETDKCYKLRFN